MAHASDMIAEDILGYLKQHEEKDILRFLTCGNVDDGKSTLIGRMLHDSKLIFEDQLAAIKKDSQKFNTTDQEFDLALLVDGLQSEREQGITIDVAYRYFSTDKRKFIIADCPGHEQYTRNMATGASSCDVAVILIDARKGIQTQTRRHSYIVSLLGIKNVIVAINKMDLVDFSEEVFNQISADYQAFAATLGFNNVYPIPLSALRGDNVVDRSNSTDWYTGPTMVELLETIPATNEAAEAFDGFRMPVQYVNRPNLDFRGFCGTVAAGELQPGDTITTLPSGKSSKVTRIVTADGDLDMAVAGEAITITLEDEIDISRGDLIYTGKQPLFGDRYTAELVWMHEDPMTVGKEYLFKAGTKSVFGKVISIQHRVDVNTMQHIPADQLQLNEVGMVTLDFNGSLALDSYEQVHGTGSFVVIDRISNVTVGAGMVRGLAEAGAQKAIADMSYDERVAAFNREVEVLVRKYFSWGGI
ncbi:sulfate adenylyltransferase subunit CysN [Oceanobacter mangrovi]|uniref:sulfate adenylyltransferase subunit CysN n=1 Tax=Oceanobacter mangrovi TaxID=2862510 RepID=UPI001C8CFCA2|nr:sulfate adenylyltransferase subunit CysN [Oceanobacter mangrovi]